MSTITTILGTDQATNSRSVINTNFSNLNTDKYQSGDSPTFATTYSPILIGGTSTTSSLTYKTTTGVGTTGADHIFLVGNNGATTAMRIFNSGNISIGTNNESERLYLLGGVFASDYGSGGYVVNKNYTAIYSTSNSGASYPFEPSSGLGNLIIQPRTSAARDVIIATRTSDSVVEPSLVVKYNGSIILGKISALATTATDGFAYIPTTAGTPTGVPTSYTGKVPIVFDDTNNKLYVYDGANWIAMN